MTLQNGGTIEAKDIIKHAGLIKQPHNKYEGRTQRDIKHKVGDAFISVPVTKPFKVFADVFQDASTPWYGGFILSVAMRKVHSGIMNILKKGVDKTEFSSYSTKHLHIDLSRVVEGSAL